MKKQYKMSENDKRIIKEVCTPRFAIKAALTDAAQELLMGAIITLIVLSVILGSSYEQRARNAINGAYAAISHLVGK